MRRRTVRRALIPALLSLALAALAAAPAAGFERLEQYGVGVPDPGNGGVSTPMGVAVAPDGTVVVADIASNRVAVFGRSGRFLRAFGKDVSLAGGDGPEVCVSDCKSGVPGGAAGELNGPWGIAASATEIYVSELSNNRVSVFDFEGRFLRAFGADVGGPGVNVCTATCVPGATGPAGGRLNGVAGVTLDPSGRLLVGEFGGWRVDIFDPLSGQFLRAFGKDVGGPGVDVCTTACTVGSGVSEPGSVIGAASLSVAPSGEVFVIDQINSQVSVFGPGGEFRRRFGSAGGGAGQLNNPHGVVANGSGVFVADAENDRLALFGEAGEFRGALGFNVVPGLPEGAELCTTLCQAGAFTYGAGSFAEPRGVAGDCRGAVYVGMLGRVEKWGEPGVAAPPCPPPSPPPAPVATVTPAAVPSNEFTIGKPRLNRKKGIATLRVTVPGAGSLVAATPKRMRARAPQPAAAGTVKVTVRAAGAGLKALSSKSGLKGKLTVTYTPAGGAPNTKSRTIRLAKKQKRKRAKRGKARAAKPKAGKGS